MSHSCETPGRVCCVGASTKPNDLRQSAPVSETTSNPMQVEAEEAATENDGHDKECSGRYLYMQSLSIFVMLHVLVLRQRCQVSNILSV